MPLKFITSATITLYEIGEVAIYQSEIISSNGNIFKPYDTSTNLSFNIYHEFKNVTDQFTDIEWTRFSFESDHVIEDKSWGASYKGIKYIEVDKDTINGKCLIQADAYTVIKGIRTCVASARITLIDVNELYSENTPPENPTDGMLWIDTSSNPLIIYSWNESLSKWEAVGTTTPFVRNLIHNSNFWKLDHTGFQPENSEFLMALNVSSALDKYWLRIKSSTITEVGNSAGVSQTTTYPILKNADYTFSFLAYAVNNIEYVGNSIYIKILSINEYNASTEILTVSKAISDKNPTQISESFKTLNDTTNIRVFVGVDPGRLCEFYITELSLYNTNTFYPWELSPEDVQEQLDNKLDNDHIAVFNALTKNGSMEGFYIGLDENGDEHYYFNATHIKTGSIDGGLINGIGLNIKDDATGESIFHVYKDDKGTHIDMTANNLYIGPAKEAASTVKYVDANIIETKEYADGEIAANRAESEELLNGNIATAKTEAISSSNSYTDGKIVEAIVQNESYTNDQVGDSQTFLVTYIDNKASDAETNANNYTDELVADISSSNNTNTASLRREIRQAKEDAISDANAYTDDEVSDARSDMTTYIDNKAAAITNVVNNKADASVVSNLSTTVDAIDKRTTTNMIVNTVTSSTTYINNLNSKLSSSTFETHKQAFETHEQAFENHVDDYNNHVSTFSTHVNAFNSFRQSTNSKLESTLSADSVISAINNSAEAERIDSSRVDINIDASVFDSFNLSTVYTNNGVYNTYIPNYGTVLSINNLVDSIEFAVDDLNIQMNVNKIEDTNYVKLSEDGANIYIDNNEMIKLLLYEIKNLKAEIENLKNNI